MALWEVCEEAGEDGNGVRLARAVALGDGVRVALRPLGSFGDRR